MRAQRGIALIQVLLITGIIGLLMAQLGMTAKEQLARARLLEDRATLQLGALSRESALVYSLLTEPWRAVPDSANPYAATWNFIGEPFTVDGITFTIQDESGRWRVPLYGAGEFEDILAGLGVAPGRARQLGVQLMALQGVSSGLRELGDDAPERASAAARGYPLQDLAELRLLPDMDEELYARLRPLLTLYPTPGFNPMTAAPELLQAQLTPSQLQGLIDARSAGPVDTLTFMKVTGLQTDERLNFSKGPALEIGIEFEKDGSRIQRDTTFIIRPYQSEPVAVWQRSMGSGEGTS
jgi:general secretion pathway protein K